MRNTKRHRLSPDAKALIVVALGYMRAADGALYEELVSNGFSPDTDDVLLEQAKRIGTLDDLLRALSACAGVELLFEEE